MKRLISVIMSLVLGAAFIGFGIWSHNEIANDTAVYLETEAVISEIEKTTEYINDDWEYRYTVYVDYTVDGKDYTHIEYGEYDSSMDEGDTLTIQYDEANPENLKTPNEGIIPWILIGAGIVSILGGAISFFKVR